MSKGGKLTQGQRLFVYEFLIDNNATQAAIRAGFSEKSAKDIGHELTRNPLVKAEIEKHLSRRLEKLEIKGEKILQRLDNIGGVDIRLAFDENNCLLPVKEMPDEIAYAIASVEVFEEFGPEGVKIGETKKVRFWDKVKSNELLGKNKKLFTEKVEITDRTRLAERMALARKRVSKK